MNNLFKKFHSYRGILFLSFIAYSTAYLCRLNISPALPSIQAELGFSDTQLGSITSAFFWIYACGQLLNGWLACKIPSRYMVGVGLLGSALCNFLFSVSTSPLVLMAIWGVNGLFQSMLWGPLMKSICNWCKPLDLPKASFAMSISCIIGNALANGFSGFMSVRVSWQICFLVPAIIAAVVGVFILLAYHGEPKREELLFDIPDEATAPREKIQMPLGKFILLANLPLLLILAISNGCIKDGFNVWYPKILDESGLIPKENSWLLLLFLPIMNFIAVSLCNFIKKKFRVPCEKLLTIILLITAAVALVLFLVPMDATLVFLILMVLMSVLMAANNPVLTAYIPFTYANYSYVSVVAGSIDFAIYLGSALSGYVIGAIGDNTATVGEAIHGISIFWLIAALASAVVGIVLMSILSHRKKSHIDDGRTFE